MSTLIKTASIVVIILAGTGQLPRLVKAVRRAQVHLIQETKASTWGQLPMLRSGRVVHLAK